ncbi:DUF554 domain-containing protein [Limosilactobacillus sp.]|jgi:uncharacterized membrane protein YqgA involved in biofilm formation|uniref:DUF554 domain-containing protein n=1 Tax=Limosilactobacillus sp. TaxID=2773925 RepID=UPI0025C2B347|nr:DUF554 domain-containing protein [Limosilactobacillus sp.]MCH3922901.1 DUF554 domain-containing protein [Limosilactobacillus sp.]MCH3927584.1 DUF554 domain-containing protein [Limosilactobacillus sp.]
MIGTYANTCAILLGTSIGCLLKRGISKKYEEALFTVMGLAALGIGLENVINNMPKSHYPVLFIVSLAIGALVGTWLNLDERFARLIKHFGGKSQLVKGLATGILLCCIGALSIVGPVMAAVRHDSTMLFTNATLDFVTTMVFGASFGWGMLLVAPVLFCWQGGIYLVAKYLSADFFTGPLVTEIAIVGGFLIATTGLSLLKIKEIKTLNILPSLLVPVIFFIIKDFTGLF